MGAFFPLFANKSSAVSPPLWLAERLLTSETGLTSNQANRAAISPAPARSGHFRIECLGWRETRHHLVEWQELVTRCIEPNTFLEPAFALTLAQHSPAARRPAFLLVFLRQRNEEPGRLIGLCALATEGKFDVMARGWRPALSACGAPLLDSIHGADAFDLMLGWCAQRSRNAAGMLFPMLNAGGKTAALIRSRAVALGLATESLGVHARAILPVKHDMLNWRDTISAGRLKELQRQRRRLDECGDLAWVGAEDPKSVRLALERFLVLESAGWKGGQGTALLNDPAIATFARTTTRMLAREGKCRIDSFELDGRPIAMGITISSGKSASLWKIAYDQEFSSLSPGVQFILEYTRRQIVRPEVSFTDSCAVADHPMIDRLWRDRMGVEDILVAVTASRAEAFRSAVEREVLRRRTRDFVKRTYHAVRGRRGGRPLSASVQRESAPGNHIR